MENLKRKFYEKYLKVRKSFVLKPLNQPNTSASIYESNVYLKK